MINKYLFEKIVNQYNITDPLSIQRIGIAFTMLCRKVDSFLHGILSEVEFSTYYKDTLSLLQYDNERRCVAHLLGAAHGVAI